MKKFVKENLLEVLIIILATSFLFYWFQFRPAQIKKECSWVEKQTEAIPEVTQAEINQAKIDFASCEKKYPEGSLHSGYLGIPTPDVSWDDFNNMVSCRGLGKLASEVPHPAVPSKTYYVATDPAQYNFCVHSRGL